MNNVALIQARLGSNRLPKKMLMEIHGQTLLDWVVSRTSKSKRLDKVIVCTSDKANDDPIENHCQNNNYEFFRGNENDVLSRFCEAAKKYPSKNIIRICGDNPLINPIEIDNLINHFEALDNYDYSFNHIPTTQGLYPDGLGAEIIKNNTLIHLNQKLLESDPNREHVTKYIFDHPCSFLVSPLKWPYNKRFEDIKLDIDTIDDLKKMTAFISFLKKEKINIYSSVEICKSFEKFNKNQIIKS
jgi:spore coat polysaccharide biosynthesis protein SpsF